MKCARLHLQERFKSKVKPTECYLAEKPLRYCQKRMINPEHEEDPRWTGAYERFHCLEEYDKTDEIIDSCRENNTEKDLFLSVQTLQFQGNVEQPKRSRNSFKYKSSNVTGKHRMFVKQAIPDDDEDADDDRSSHVTYYFDDYVKYLFDIDKSRPTSGKSSVFVQSSRNTKENKATQVDERTSEGNRKLNQGIIGPKVKSLLKGNTKVNYKEEIENDDPNINDTKITFSKSGRRKSLTISRAQSPEVMQVIRVDVVCNHSRSSAMSEYEVNTKQDYKEPLADFDIESIDLKKSHFANKYLLTSTMKTLDENLAGGEKVTLLCKTFKLSERSQASLPNKPRVDSENKSKKKKVKTYGPKLGKLQEQVSNMFFRINNM